MAIGVVFLVAALTLASTAIAGAQSFAPLPTLGPAIVGSAGPDSARKFRIVLVYLATRGKPTDRPLLVRNPLLPGRIPEGGTYEAGPNWLRTDTLDLHTYTKDAIEYYLEAYSYGALDVTVDVPMDGDTPIWESAHDGGKAVVDDVLARIDTKHPGYFDTTGFDYQRVGYVFVGGTGGLRGTISTPSNGLWATAAGRAIWSGATFAVGCAWPGTKHVTWDDAHTWSGVNAIVHEIMHHLAYAAGPAGALWDRGVRDYHTRTWGFDIMDHNGIGMREKTNGHYGLGPLAPVDQYFLGFIAADRFETIVEGRRDVRIAQNGATPGEGKRQLYRIPLSEGTESFIISSHTGTGLDEAYNAGYGRASDRVAGLQIWHIDDGYDPASPRGMRGTADVEVAWTLAPGDTYHHPDGARSWPVGRYLDTEYTANYDWIDCTPFGGGHPSPSPPLYPPGGEGLSILAGAYGGWSPGTPPAEEQGGSRPYCNRVRVGGRLRWVNGYDNNIISPTPKDFFRAGDEFTPYSRPNTDRFHLYGATSNKTTALCAGSALPTPREGRITNLVVPAGPTRVAIRNIRTAGDTDMLFDVDFNYWEGRFGHSANFGELSEGVWDTASTPGVVRAPFVVGPDGFTVASNETLTVRSGVTVLGLGPLRVAGALRAERGVVFAGLRNIEALPGGSVRLDEEPARRQ